MSSTEVSTNTSQAPPASQESNARVVIVRTKTAGCFMGDLLAEPRPTSAGVIVNLANARRLWFWAGAASLSQLAMEGTKIPNECKFPCPVSHVQLIEAIEIIDVTPAAKLSIDRVPVWAAPSTGQS